MKKDDKKDDERRNKLIGANIQKYRKSIGMTQEGLAESLGLSAGHMTALENGYTGISLPKFIEVSKILKMCIRDRCWTVPSALSRPCPILR